MKKSEVVKVYQKKIEEYTTHNKYYYEKSNPTITDQKFDSLKKEILELEEKNNFLRNNKSPSKSIGYKPSKNFQKVKHKVPMLSLGNAFNEEDIKNFEKK